MSLIHVLSPTFQGQLIKKNRPLVWLEVKFKESAWPLLVTRGYIKKVLTYILISRTRKLFSSYFW